VVTRDDDEGEEKLVCPRGGSWVLALKTKVFWWWLEENF